VRKVEQLGRVWSPHTTQLHNNQYYIFYMEANIQAVLTQTHEIDKELCGRDHVKGILLTSAKGFPIKSQGEGKASLASGVSCVATLAALIEPEEDNPVICIEAGVRKYLIKKEEQVTVLIIKEQ
jgi:hypothetical protein